MREGARRKRTMWSGARRARETSQRDRILPAAAVSPRFKTPARQTAAAEALTCSGPASSGSSLHWK